MKGWNKTDLKIYPKLSGERFVKAILKDIKTFEKYNSCKDNRWVQLENFCSEILGNDVRHGFRPREYNLYQIPFGERGKVYRDRQGVLRYLYARR